VEHREFIKLFGGAAKPFAGWEIPCPKICRQSRPSESEGCVMPIAGLLQQAAFDPEATRILMTAFDKAWDKFKSSGSALADDACAPSTRALLAKRIIETAQRGERNIDRLVEDGVTYLERVTWFNRHNQKFRSSVAHFELVSNLGVVRL
jgi:hypothetical protein